MLSALLWLIDLAVSLAAGALLQYWLGGRLSAVPPPTTTPLQLAAAPSPPTAVAATGAVGAVARGGGQRRAAQTQTPPVVPTPALLVPTTNSSALLEQSGYEWADHVDVVLRLREERTKLRTALVGASRQSTARSEKHVAEQAAWATDRKALELRATTAEAALSEAKTRLTKENLSNAAQRGALVDQLGAMHQEERSGLLARLEMAQQARGTMQPSPPPSPSATIGSGGSATSVSFGDDDVAQVAESAWRAFMVLSGHTDESASGDVQWWLSRPGDGDGRLLDVIDAAGLPQRQRRRLWLLWSGAHTLRDDASATFFALEKQASERARSETHSIVASLATSNRHVADALRRVLVAYAAAAGDDGVEGKVDEALSSDDDDDEKAAPPHAYVALFLIHVFHDTDRRPTAPVDEDIVADVMWLTSALGAGPMGLLFADWDRQVGLVACLAQQAASVAPLLAPRLAELDATAVDLLLPHASRLFVDALPGPAAAQLLDMALWSWAGRDGSSSRDVVSPLYLHAAVTLLKLSEYRLLAAATANGATKAILAEAAEVPLASTLRRASLVGADAIEQALAETAASPSKNKKQKPRRLRAVGKLLSGAGRRVKRAVATRTNKSAKSQSPPPPRSRGSAAQASPLRRAATEF